MPQPWDGDRLRALFHGLEFQVLLSRLEGNQPKQAQLSFGDEATPSAPAAVPAAVPGWRAGISGRP